MSEVVPGTTVPTEGPMDPTPEAAPEVKAEAAPEVKAEAAPEVKPEAAPEVKPEPIEYGDFTAPEGMELDAKMVDSFKGVAKDMGITKENAQKLMDLATSHFSGIQTATQEQAMETRVGWVNELKSDAEFGGANFDKTVEHAKRAVGRFGTPELSNFLSHSGMGDNNHVIKMLAKIGSELSEDNFVDGQAHSSQKSVADILFDGK